MKKTKSARIAMIRKNLDQNQEEYQSGKRSREVYLRCKKDGQSRIAELKRS